MTFFYSARPSMSSGVTRRLTLAPSSQLNVGQLSYHIPEILSRANEVQELFRHDWNRNDSFRRDLERLEICAAPVSPVFSINDSRRPSRQKLVLRRPTISIQDDGKIIIGWCSRFLNKARVLLPYLRSLQKLLNTL